MSFYVLGRPRSAADTINRHMAAAEDFRGQIAVRDRHLAPWRCIGRFASCAEAEARAAAYTNSTYAQFRGEAQIAHASSLTPERIAQYDREIAAACR
jgi:hypothetical protein